MNTSHELYNQIAMETEVMSASNHRLIQMLFEKSLQQIKLAIVSIETKQINKKYKSISNAMDVVHYLRFCLNKEDKSSQELTALLTSLYDFIESHLLKASLANDTESLNQAYKILALIKSGWDGISQE